MKKKIHPGNNDLNILSLFNDFQISLKVGLYSGCDSDVTDLQCRFQHRYPITATTHVITKQHELKTIVATRQKGNDFAMSIASPSQQFHCSSHPEYKSPCIVLNVK